ncbi:uncharacterized protein NPIL_10371 [Nephila pilipes]|uniref:DNA-directed DNA polymerase n=1 Tax=Nephila pilipes TaxID=299642 RepID=A0A8X6QYT7_NEPPI|nr:uncharacterized protein NPIL_10371 [Nephila pilipes]
MSNGAPTIGQTTDAIRTLFETLLRRVTSSLEPTDLMRVIIFSDHLDRPISTHLMLVSEMSVEKIMACAVKVLQSKSEVRLDEGFNVEIITIRRPIGSGKTNRRVTIPSLDRLRKKSIRCVPDDDLNICCAKAILLAIAEVEKDADLKSLRRKDCDLLKRRAIALHQKTGVPQGPCGFEEIALFEQNLKMQVVVISTTASNQVCYKGPDRKDRRIYLWLHDNHFDVITSPKGEQKIAGLSVDGFCKETNTVYQYQGCFHHGCEMCYDGDLIHPLTGTTMRSLLQKTKSTIDTLRQRGYNVIQMLEHDFANLKKTESFQEFLLQHEIKDVFLPTPEIAAFQWTQSNDFITQDSSTNIFIAAFTTCHARLKLYSEIEKLNESVLYFDTDSIIYKSDGKNDPPLGNFLGEFTDELNGGIITSFVTGGPKNYAYKLLDGSEACKIRGFTLNFQNSLVLNFDSVKELVYSMDTTRSMTVINPRKITRDKKKRKIENKMEIKTYKMVYDKRVIQEDFNTLPYGY